MGNEFHAAQPGDEGQWIFRTIRSLLPPLGTSTDRVHLSRMQRHAGTGRVFLARVLADTRINKAL
jgi:hypothetical protein